MKSVGNWERLGMKSEWTIKKLSEIADFNPRESLRKGTVAKKVGMDKLQPFCRDIPFYELEAYTGGTKFRNGDTIMARITPCLENGKTAKVNILEEGEIGFGSTEYIVFRAKESVDEDFLYYLVCSSIIREPAIKSMVGSSGRQRVQTDVVENLDIAVPSYEEQHLIGRILRNLDDKIKINNKINENLQQQAFAVFNNLIANAENNDYTVSDYAFLNPKRTLAKKQVARSIDMSQLSTSGSFPSGWEMKSFNGGMRFTNGDTLLARITPCLENGKTAFIDFLDDGEVAFGSTEYIVLTPKNDTPPEMLYCLARYPAFVDYAVKNMNGSSGRQRVSAETVGQYRLPLFDKHSLVLFKEVVAPMFLKMRYNSLENMRLTELRDALLPKLMSGEIDVSTVQL